MVGSGGCGWGSAGFREICQLRLSTKKRRTRGSPTRRCATIERGNGRKRSQRRAVGGMSSFSSFDEQKRRRVSPSCYCSQTNGRRRETTDGRRRRVLRVVF
ncbi:unnamed protein product [Calypogeia fissa]